MKKITFITDTHTKHKQLSGFLPGGDMLICAGDITSVGSLVEIENFCTWFDGINNYDHKIFIAGNHDWGFQDNPKNVLTILKDYKTIDYLQDELLLVGDDNYQEMIKVYGAPWTPEFCNWAFNLKRGNELKEKWDLIPIDTDILITHGPPHGKLDYTKYENKNVGCEELLKRVQEIKPKIHVFGHVHESYGYVFDGNTHYINAAVLNGRYIFQNKPLIVEWDEKTNELEFK